MGISQPQWRIRLVVVVAPAYYPRTVANLATCKANNVRGQWKRAICSAIFVGLGASGGMTGSLVYRSQDAPKYRPGILVSIGLTCLSIVLVGLLSLRLHYLNKKVDKGELVIGGLRGFKYTL